MADPGRYPYFVRLEYGGPVGCGGTLVWSDLILTAAHCAYPDVNWRRIEAVIENGDPTVDNERRRKIRRVVPHPIFDDDTNKYDVALLQIDPVENAPLVQLAKPEEFALVASDDVTVLGYGATTEEGENSDVLREASLQVVDDRECSFQYSRGDIHFPSMICAADVGKEGPCYRDSGGPLLVLGEEMTNANATQPDLQVGVVSFGGSRCGDPEQASVYSDVIHVQPWVDSAICRYSAAPPVGCESSDKILNGTEPSSSNNDDDAPSGGLPRTIMRWLLLAQLLFCVVLL